MAESEPGGAKVVSLKGRPCPICGRSAAARLRPFCRRRCADVDPGRWLKEGCRLPAESGAADGDSEAGTDAGTG